MNERIEPTARIEPIRPMANASARLASMATPPAATPRTRPAPPPDQSPVPHQKGTLTAGVAVNVRHDGDTYFGPWWLAKLPGRLWILVLAVALPFRIAVWLLDAAVAAILVLAAGVAWAIWTQRITDDQISSVVGQIGARTISILSKSGIL